MKRRLGQLARRMRRGLAPWHDAVEDPRDPRGRRHGHHGLLNLLVLTFATGGHTLRRAEDLAEDLGPVARRLLGLAKRVSDTALYLLLKRQSVTGLRETLLVQVKNLWRRKRLRNDAFPLGVMAFDGKSVWASARKGMDGAKEAVQGDVTVASLAMMNAVLVSSSSTPCVDLQLIRGREAEPAAFRDMVERLAADFAHFDVVTADAGLLSRENAALLRELDKHFVMGLKANQPKLAGFAEAAFAHVVGDARAVEVSEVDGERITRMLHVRVVDDAPAFDLPGAREVWRVTKRIETPGLPAETEVRYFVSSLEPRALSGPEKLQLVRLHWRIENNRHWTLDVLFREDERQPCLASPEAVEVACWLRALAFNLVANLRARGPRKDGKPLPWARTMEKARMLLVMGRREDLASTLA